MVNLPAGYDPVQDSSYHYAPTEYVAIIFVVLFGLSTLVHFVQAIYFRMWWLLPTVVLAGIGEVIGWSGRLWSSLDDGFSGTPFLIQISTTIISPTPLLAVYFVLLGRLILLLGQQYSRLRHRNYIIIFTIADVVALVVQAVGGGLASSATTFQGSQNGGRIALGGIVFQLISLSFYMALGIEYFIRFHYNRPYRTSETTIELKSSNANSTQSVDAEESQANLQEKSGLFGSLPPKKRLGFVGGKLQLLLLGMSFSVLCLFIRAIYRTVELADGWNGRIISTQVYFNVLDGMMVLLAIWTLNIFHPGSLYPKSQ